MLKNIIFPVLIFLFMTSNAQNYPAGKSFTAQVNASCKKFASGTCMIYTHCKLSFTNDMVSIFYSTTADCTDKTKESNYNKELSLVGKYKWSINGDTIQIKDADDYAVLIKAGGMLTAKPAAGSGRKSVVFKEE